MKGRIAGIVVLLALWGAAPLRAEPLRVGRAAVKITPEIGTPMGSSYGITISDGVHDDIYCKAIVLEQNGEKGALVACDLISIRGAIVQEARRQIERTTGLEGDRVILSATHCHAGPQMHPLFLRQVGGEGERKGLEYIRLLPARIAESVRLAEQDLQPAQLLIGRSREDSLSFNRRFLMRDGSVRMNPGRSDPEVVRPVGLIDPEVMVASFQGAESGAPLALLVNFALHVAVVGGREISADYPGVLSERLSGVLGEGLVTVFTNGTSGNINHVDVKRRDQLSGRAESRRIGTVLASRVLELLSTLEPVETAPLRVRSRPVELAARPVRETEVEEARQVMARYGKDRSLPFQDVVRAWRVLDLAELGGRPMTSEVQALSLGDQVAFVGFPGDAFVELGLHIKTNSPFPFTAVSEQSGNGSLSYVPNLKAFWEGGYEVISARFLPGGGEVLADSAVRLLIDLFPHRPFAPVQ